MKITKIKKHKIIKEKDVHRIMRFIFFASTLFYFLYSAFIWISFLIPSTPVNIFYLAVLIIYFVINRHDFEITKNKLVATVMFILSALWFIVLGYQGITLLLLFPLLIYYLNNHEKLLLLRFITINVGYILLISMVLFGLSYIIELPSFGNFKSDYYGIYSNYIFFLKSKSWLDAIAYRFNGPFIEPGHLAMMGSFLLIANRMSLKTLPLKSILVAILLSFSLAGYVILFLGFVFLRMRSIKIFMASLILGIVIIITATTFWNNGDNPLEILILDRLEYSEDKGIEGNNRFLAKTDMIYRNASSSELAIGMYNDRYRHLTENSIVSGAGYKLFFMQYGYLSLIVLFFYYLSFTWNYNDKRFAFIFITIILISFIQRSYILSFSWFLPFICSMSGNYKKNRFISM